MIYVFVLAMMPGVGQYVVSSVDCILQIVNALLVRLDGYMGKEIVLNAQKAMNDDEIRRND